MTNKNVFYFEHTIVIMHYPYIYILGLSIYLLVIFYVTNKWNKTITQEYGVYVYIFIYFKRRFLLKK